MNANDAELTELATAYTNSTIENNAPNAPDQPGFDLVIEGVAGSVAGSSGAPYTLTVSAMDLTTVQSAPDLVPSIPAQYFDVPTGWKPNGPDFEYSQSLPVTIPLTGGAGTPRKYVGHTLQYVASLVSANGQIVSIIESAPFVLV